MRKWVTQGTILAFFLMCPVTTIPNIALGEELTSAQQEAVKKEVQRILREQGFGGSSGPSSRGSASSSGSRSIENLAETARTGTTKSGATKEGSGALIYARPFVAKPKAILGGYADFEYINRKNDGEPSTFDAHRLVPFIYADVTDRVKFATEIEFEHSGRGKNDGDLEIGVEFMTIDYLVNEPVNLRAGVILLPLGKFNLLHDAPLRDLTDRPLVTRYVIPTTLRQAGVGTYGTFYPTRLSKLDYELYVTNGFTADAISGSSGTRSARFGGDDNNDGKSVVGRVAFSPFLGVEIGGSGFYGKYHSSGTPTKSLTIAAVDWTFQRGPFEFIGEWAGAWAPDNALGATPGVGVPTQDMDGYYAQINYHFLPQFLTTWAPTFFRPQVSIFTAALRWEETDLNKDVDGNFTTDFELQRLTAGLNFRPIEDSVFKLDFQYEPMAIGSVNGVTAPVHEIGFLASWATYF